MDERTVQFRVGVMVLATVLILAILLLLFGDLPSLVKGTYTVNFAFPQAPGVMQDTPIRVNGVLIGRVREVQLDEKVGVMITATIEDKYVLYRDQVGRIGGSLLGDAVIESVPSTLVRPHEKVADGDTNGATVGLALDHGLRPIPLQDDVDALVVACSRDRGSVTLGPEHLG